jgi:hypothetical protein
MVKKILIISMVLVFGAAALFAHDVTGRDVVDSGALVTLEGTLRYESPEWYLDTQEGSYLLHFGNRGYLESTGIPIEDGKKLSVEGFAEGSDIAVVSASADGKTYSFRNRDGVPFWAGRGNRYAKNGEDGCRGWFQGNGSGRGPANRRPGAGRFGPRDGWDGPRHRQRCW